MQVWVYLIFLCMLFVPRRFLSLLRRKETHQSTHAFWPIFTDEYVYLALQEKEGEISNVCRQMHDGFHNNNCNNKPLVKKEKDNVSGVENIYWGFGRIVPENIGVMWEDVG